MTQIDNLADARQEIADLKRRISQLERQAPIGFSSVSRGALRIASAEGLVVEGSAKITGILDGDGTLHWTGTVQFEGPVQIVGNVTRSGNETATGTTTLNGQTNLNGDTTVQGDLDVTGAGVIRVGAVTISPANGGQISIGPLTIHADGTISNSAGSVHVTSGLLVDGAAWLQGAVRMPNISTVSAGQTPNLWLDSAGSARRIT